MAKKATPSYAGLSLDAAAPAAAPPADQAAEPAPEQPAPQPRPRKAQDEAGKVEKGQPYVTYLHPRGHRALRLYALEAGTSLQAIIIESLETWAKKHGITEPMRPLRTK